MQEQGSGAAAAQPFPWPGALEGHLTGRAGTAGSPAGAVLFVHMAKGELKHGVSLLSKSLQILSGSAQ